MKMLYIDDPELGIIRETCHPNFNSILKEEIYIDIIEEFSPFGNDEGNDTLRFLENWYQENFGDDYFILDFITEYLLKTWGWDESYIKYLYEYDLDKIKEINEEYEYLLDVLPQTMIAVTYGQLKIIGYVDDVMITICEKMIEQQKIITNQKIRDNNLDYGKLFKIVNGNTTWLNNDGNMDSIFLGYLNWLDQVKLDLTKIPIKMDE